MIDPQISYNTKVYVRTNGGPYDPAPLEEFNLHEQPQPPTIMPGDVLCSWSKLSGEAKGRNHYYKVVERMFRLETKGYDVFVLVEEVEPGWTQNFD